MSEYNDEKKIGIKEKLEILTSNFKVSFYPTLAIITLLGFWVRFYNIKKPNYFIFDETYYVPNAISLLNNGVELVNNEPQFIVHPPVGKWVIALGIKVFGNNSFGWRSGVLLLGTLSIVLVALIAKQLFKNTFIALSAALFTALDGVSLVQSRVAILEGSLAFFILLSFYSLLRYREGRGNKWLILLGLASGLALGVKWSSIYYIGFFAFIMLFMLDGFLNQTHEVAIGKREFVRNFSKRISINFTKVVFYLLITLSTYLTTWLGWFVSNDGWDRRKIYGSGPLNAMLNLYEYHKDMLDFHLNLTLKHNYQAGPAGWLFMWRPTAFDFKSAGNCGGEKCYYEILQLGNPIIWWLVVFALLALIYKIIKSRFKGVFSEVILLTAILVGYLPWFFFGKRTTFTFYSGVFAGFLYIVLAYVIYKASRKMNVEIRASILLLFFSLLIITFYFFYPIYAYLPLTPHLWNLHMWLNNWI